MKRRWDLIVVGMFGVLVVPIAWLSEHAMEWISFAVGATAGMALCLLMFGFRKEES